MLNVAGQQVQNIVEYKRHCELYECLKLKDVRNMDDIETGANPRWDGDYHGYATGLDVFLQPNTSGATNVRVVVVDVFTTGDHNEWGTVD